jgi:tRNA-specific 2-thiouridylase
VLDSRALAGGLGLPHLTLDLERAFRATVVETFLRGYAAGRTPNPCVVCNGELRIDAMLDLAERLGAAALATGHYARVRDDGDGPLLAAPADTGKDQTYMLAALRPESLARLRFPLADLTKPEVREIAARANLAVAAKRESQDLCFLSGEGKRSFLARHADLGERPGEIVDATGRVLGRHHGHHNFTVGQRRGLGVASGSPLYVLATDAATNRVVAGPREALATRRMRLRDVNWLGDGPIERALATGGLDVFVKVRSTRPPQPAWLHTTAGGIEVDLVDGEEGVAPGQACVFYDAAEGQARVLGGGFIASAVPRADVATRSTASVQPAEAAVRG